MAVCFKFTDKTTGETPNFSELDEWFCGLLDVPVDPKRYVHTWYDVIGFRLACGDSILQVRTYLIDSMTSGCVIGESFVNQYVSLIAITHFMESRYTVESWRE